MNTYLINAPHDQKIQTVENVDTKDILVYSNPSYFETKSLARDFNDIVEGDELIICRNSKLMYKAIVDEVKMATDKSGSKYDGLDVMILKGQLISRFNNLSVSSFANRIKNAGLEVPNLINPKLTGFKQGAFAEKLSIGQVTAGEQYIER